MINIYDHFKILICLMFYTSGLYPEISFPGMETFSSSIHLSMGGAGYLKPSSSNFNVNPAAYEGKQFSASIIKYPASILSQNIGITLPLIKSGFSSFSINHISYGTFDGYTEDYEDTGSYSSSDTKFSASYGRILSKIPLKIGLNSNYYYSKYGNQKFSILSLSTGAVISLKKQDVSLGLSIHDIAKNISENGVDLNPKLVISGSKKLKYLPLRLYVDLTSKDRSDLTIFLGGEFDLMNNFQFRLGSSTRKFDQNVDKGLFSSIVGAGGLGFGYEAQNIFVHYGVYMFGTGASIQGLEISISL